MKFKFLILVLLFLIMSAYSYAQKGATFAVSKSTIDAGGGKSDGTSYSINGSIGQTNASSKISGTSFSIKGGFWVSTPRPDSLFSDGFEN
jgi:hypothetical protein